MASLAIGAHAPLNKPAPETAKAVATEQSGRPSRIALVIGNGHYRDADVPLTQPINDARTLTAALRRDGIEVDMVEDASKDDMRHSVGRLRSKNRTGVHRHLFLRRLWHSGRRRELHDPSGCGNLARV